MKRSLWGRTILPIVVLAAASLLGGCVVYPAYGPYPGYAAYPAYGYAPYYGGGYIAGGGGWRR